MEAALLEVVEVCALAETLLEGVVLVIAVDEGAEEEGAEEEGAEVEGTEEEAVTDEETNEEGKTDTEVVMIVADVDSVDVVVTLVIGTVELASTEEAAGDTLSTGYINQFNKLFPLFALFALLNLRRGFAYRHRMVYQYRDYHNPIIQIN